MANLNPRTRLTPSDGRELSKAVIPKVASKMRPQQYDVMSGPAPMHTTPAFCNCSVTTPQVGLHLGFNK